MISGPNTDRSRMYENGFPNAVCIALTATATDRVREDIKHSLNIPENAEFIDSFDRPNLFLRIVEKRSPTQQVIKMLEKFPGPIRDYLLFFAPPGG